MRRSRTVTALAGLLVSFLLSVAAWYYLDTFLLFLFVPFVPLLLRERGADPKRGTDALTCPACGFETVDGRFEFCPFDGNPLE